MNLKKNIIIEISACSQIVAIYKNRNLQTLLNTGIAKENSISNRHSERHKRNTLKTYEKSDSSDSRLTKRLIRFAIRSLIKIVSPTYHERNPNTSLNLIPNLAGLPYKYYKDAKCAGRKMQKQVHKAENSTQLGHA